ncbi:PD-(D/E)XK nuclease family protein [Natronomonas salsuginis]|uniref:PD-(D/E)XK nuclease family protein n=1 Tax=Natronomonas salsuginis TaxID=2217661 RepID=A0A4U5JJP8_9EURY|nr:PD-(D/E)XK nuclease family protein [Natronomonas salsuginis]TKR27977.1 PD-(D/E)XK nuclease family protein [Natronomonas salsuginis]
MPIQRAKPVESLYKDVADYDLVLTPDAPLASAINRRVDVPQFGTFATTPRRLAAGRREQAEDRSAFLEVIDCTDHDWKSISYAIGNVLQCWEHQGTIESILEHDSYVDEETGDVVEIMAELQSTSRSLTEYTIDAESLAVIGEQQLTTLERAILPKEYDQVDLFTTDTFDYPSFNIFDSSADIVDAILDTVTATTAGNVAVVLDASSRYSSLIEAAFDTAGIPYYGGPGFVDEPHHRAFLNLCRTGFRGGETTVGDVKPVLTQMGIDVPIDHDNKRLYETVIPETTWIREFCQSITAHTFADALEAYESQTETTLTSFREELARLGIADTPVAADTVDELAYYLQTYEVPVDRENEGVLLADAKSAGYVDRPVVFHVGLDEDWTHSPPQRPWVDTAGQFQRYLDQFQLLIQSGVEQYYLVQDTQGGQPVTPCLYFGELLDDDYDQFSDLDAVSHRRPVVDGETGFQKEETDVEAETVEAISQSSLNSYVNSPRDYFFSRLVDGPDKDYFTEGNLFHDFAEFYVNHPDVVDADALVDVVDVMVEEARPLFAGTDEPLRRRTYLIGLETIVEYLDARGPEAQDFLTPASGWGRNFFAEYFDEPIDSPLTERWFDNTSLGIKGKIDLVRAPDHLLDFKSGRKKSRHKVVQQAAIDPPNDTPNFQAALYLCHYRTKHPDEPIAFTFFHFLETLDDVITGDADLDDTLTTVRYYPWTFDEHVGSREAYDTLLDGYNDCVATFEDLGFEAYTEIMGGLSFPDTTEKAELRESDFAARFTAAVDDRTGDDINAEKGCDQAIRELNGVRKKSFFREDLDAIERFVDNRIEELNSYRRGDDRFPVEGIGGEPNYRRIDHRDLLLEGTSDD